MSNDKGLNGDASKTRPALSAATPRSKTRSGVSASIAIAHTPGPWYVEATASAINIESDMGGVAQVLGAENPDDETLPNARLIAAAPDLLTAAIVDDAIQRHGICKKAVEEIQAHGIEVPAHEAAITNIALGKWATNLRRAAIAKATSNP